MQERVVLVANGTHSPRTQVITAFIAIAIMLFAMPGFAAARAKSKQPTSTISGSVSGGKNIKVSVVGAGMSTRTNTTGFFTMSGRRLSGSHVIRFKNGRKMFSTTVTVPSGSHVILQATALNGDGTAEPEEEDVEVEGTLTAVDCNASPNTLTVTPAGGGAAVTMSFDPAVARIMDDATDTVVTDCATLAGNFLNAPAKAEGIQSASGDIEASEVELNPGEEGNPPSHEANFRGVVQSENCPASIVVQLSDGTTVTVDISSSTRIHIEDSEHQSSANCSDIPGGANVKVEGVAQSDGSVAADNIEVQQNEFEAEGTINSTSCGSTPPSLSFTAEEASSAVTVTIGGTTIIEVGANKNAVCTDLTDSSAKVEGVIQSDGSVAASKIEQEGSEGSHGGGGQARLRR